MMNIDELIKEIEEATKYKVVLLHESVEPRQIYQIALIDEKYGVMLVVSIGYTYGDLGYYFWYIDDIHAITYFSYCIYERTIDKIKKVLNDKKHH